MNLAPFRSRTLVLLYHRIANETPDPWSLCVTPKHFAEHLEVLRNVRRVQLSQVDPHRFELFGPLQVAISFDDGYSDNATAAVPLLKKFDMPATFFIATGYMDGPAEYWWDELDRLVFESPNLPVSVDTSHAGFDAQWQFEPNEPRAGIFQFLYDQLQPLDANVRRNLLDHIASLCGAGSPPRPSRRPMSNKELRRVAADSLFEFGAHTVTHPLLAARPVAEQCREIRESKLFLENVLDRPIESFSYPYGGKGHYLPATVDAVRNCGFRHAFTTEGHAVRKRDGPFEISRRNVTDMDGDSFHKFLLS